MSSISVDGKEYNIPDIAGNISVPGNAQRITIKFSVLTYVNRSDVEEASALGAVVMNGLSRKVWNSFEEGAKLRHSKGRIEAQDNKAWIDKNIEGWHNAVKQLIK